MRILIAGINFAPELTGVGLYTGEMAIWLAARGHQVTAISAPPHYPDWVVAPEYAGKGFWRETIDGVEVLRTPVYLPGGTISTRHRVLLETSFTISSARWWLPLLAADPPDVVIAICPPLQDVVWPTAMKALRRTPWLLHVQDLQVDAAVRLGMVRNSGATSALIAAERAVLRRAPWVSTISGAMLERVRSKGVHADRSFLFPNWTDLSRMAPRRPDVAMRRRLGAADADTLVLYAGNLGQKQGLDLLIDAADRLRERRDVHIAIVGNGAERRALERTAARRDLTNLTFHDLVSSHELPTLLASADVHVVIQRGAAADLVMPSKLTNILAAGRPSIATAAAGTELHTALAGSGAGIAVPPDDASALTTAIVRLADDRAERDLMGRTARQYAIANLGKEPILTDFEARLGHVARSRTP